MSDWHTYFMSLAATVAGRSKDLSTKVGCVIIDQHKNIRATGYNGIPRDVQDLAIRLERPAKYLWTEHAERNAIFSAARIGIPLQGAALYCTHYPCADCARAIIQSGISKAYVPKNSKLATLKTSLEVAEIMFDEAAIRVVEL